MELLETRNDFTGNPFVVGTTDKALYQPFYSISTRGQMERFAYGVYHELSEYIRYGEGFYYYMKPDISDSIDDWRYLGTYRNLFEHLQDNLKRGVFTFEYNNNPYQVNAFKGCLLDRYDNILLMLTVENEEVFQRDGRYKLDYSKFRLFVSTNLITDEIYTNFYKKLYSEFIEKLIKLGIETIFSNSEKIQNIVYANNFNVEFNTISELNEHLSSGIGDLLFTDYSEFRNAQEPETFEGYTLTNPVTSDGEIEMISEVNSEEQLTEVQGNRGIFYQIQEASQRVADYNSPPVLDLHSIPQNLSTEDLDRLRSYVSPTPILDSLNREDFITAVNSIEAENNTNSDSVETDSSPF